MHPMALAQALAVQSHLHHLELGYLSHFVEISINRHMTWYSHARRLVREGKIRAKKLGPDWVINKNAIRIQFHFRDGFPYDGSPF